MDDIFEDGATGAPQSTNEKAGGMKAFYAKNKKKILIVGLLGAAAIAAITFVIMKNKKQQKKKKAEEEALANKGDQTPAPPPTGEQSGSSGTILSAGAAHKLVSASDLMATLTNSGGIPTLVLFSMAECGYCKKFAPVWDATTADIIAKYGSNIRVISIGEVESTQKVLPGFSKNIVESYGVTGFPTVLLFKSGSAPAMYDGAGTADGLKQWLGQRMSSA